MDKNHKSILVLAIIFVTTIGMFVIYANFQADQKLIQEQQQQNLTPEQMENGIKSFINSTTSNIHPPPKFTP